MEARGTDAAATVQATGHFLRPRQRPGMTTWTASHGFTGSFSCQMLQRLRPRKQVLCLGGGGHRISTAYPPLAVAKLRRTRHVNPSFQPRLQAARGKGTLDGFDYWWSASASSDGARLRQPNQSEAAELFLLQWPTSSLQRASSGPGGEEAADNPSRLAPCPALPGPACIADGPGWDEPSILPIYYGSAKIKHT
jgi:hypothetical protein